MINNKMLLLLLLLSVLLLLLVSFHPDCNLYYHCFTDKLIQQFQSAYDHAETMLALKDRVQLAKWHDGMMVCNNNNDNNNNNSSFNLLL